MLIGVPCINKEHNMLVKLDSISECPEKRKNNIKVICPNISYFHILWGKKLQKHTTGEKQVRKGKIVTLQLRYPSDSSTINSDILKEINPDLQKGLKTGNEVVRMLVYRDSWRWFLLLSIRTKHFITDICKKTCCITDFKIFSKSW